eukprot:429119-Rhodomonas_salina.4
MAGVGCGPQVGFALLDSTQSGGLHVLYFEERNETADSFDAILACVRQAACVLCMCGFEICSRVSGT